MRVQLERMPDGDTFAVYVLTPGGRVRLTTVRLIDRDALTYDVGPIEQWPDADASAQAEAFRSELHTALNEALRHYPKNP